MLELYRRLCHISVLHVSPTHKVSALTIFCLTVHSSKFNIVDAWYLAPNACLPLTICFHNLELSEKAFKFCISFLMNAHDPYEAVAQCLEHFC